MSDKDEKKSFVLYCDYAEHVSLLTDEDAGKLFKALFSYVNSGTIQELSPVASMAFSFIRSQLDRDRCKWEEIRKKRSEAGRLGGKSKGKKQNLANEANAFFDNHSETNKADTVIVNGIVTDNANEKKIKHIYGSFKHVRLTDDEIEKLIADYGKPIIDDYIKRVDEYCQQFGKTYKDYNLTIRNWIRKDGVNSGGKCNESESSSVKLW